MARAIKRIEDKVNSKNERYLISVSYHNGTIDLIRVMWFIICIIARCPYGCSLKI